MTEFAGFAPSGIVKTEVLLRTLLVISSVALPLLIAEGVLRLAGYSYTPLRIEVSRKNDWRYHHAFRDKHFVYDPVLIWRPKIGSATFNSQGYRGREVAPTKGGKELRIFAFGDSNTLGWSGPTGSNWPGYLQQLFDRTTASVTVVNAGVYGYTSFQGLHHFQDALRLEPDIALISFGANDAHLVTISDSEFVDRPVWRRIDFLLAQAKLGQLIHASVDRFSRRQDRLVRRVSLADYTRYLEQMVSLGKTNGIRVVLLTRPFTGSSPDPSWWKNTAPAYNRATIEVGTRTGVPVIDAYAYFEKYPEYFADESHFTEAGHRRMADLVLEQIEPLPIVRTSLRNQETGDRR